MKLSSQLRLSLLIVVNLSIIIYLISDISDGSVDTFKTLLAQPDRGILCVALAIVFHGVCTVLSFRSNERENEFDAL